MAIVCVDILDDVSDALLHVLKYSVCKSFELRHNFMWKNRLKNTALDDTIDSQNRSIKEELRNKHEYTNCRLGIAIALQITCSGITQLYI